MQELITLACAEDLTEEEIIELGFNNGFAFNADKAELIGKRLTAITEDERTLELYRDYIFGVLPGVYEKCWSRENIVEFAEFLENCGGFEVW